MTDPEYVFDESDPGDYRLFGIHYLLLPAAHLPPVPARLVRRDGPYSLWTVSTVGYVQVGTIVGRVTANRTDVGERSIALLHSRLPAAGDYLLVDFGSGGGLSAPLPSVLRRASAGTVIDETDDLDQGDVSATVRMRRPGAVVLSASFDPGWTATVDGRSRRTEMVAPALVATSVAAGTHTIVFRYRGFRGYPVLFALCGLTLVALLLRDSYMRRSAGA